MACKRDFPADQDPDYENIIIHQNKRQKLFEKDAKEATVKKIETIIKNQFVQSIMNKETEIQIANQRLQQARRLFDRLRAYIVASYYSSGGKSSSEQNTQTAIHPAVKKHLLGKRPKESLGHLLVNNVATNLSNAKQVNKIPLSSTSQTNKTQAQEVPASSKSLESSSESKSKSDSSLTSDGIRGSRFKSKKRIIVGNVSKFIPMDKREDNDQATHKWMVYVRGTKEEPSIDHFVKKVWFFLHPSYRPNDLVEVSQPPFHLTRRGWGEFPIRVQLHFHDSRNKRVDVIHMLKLDKSYTGLQTLGAETVVDILIYKPEDRLTSEYLHSITKDSHLENKEDSTSETVEQDKTTVNDEITNSSEHSLKTIKQNNNNNNNLVDETNKINLANLKSVKETVTVHSDENQPSSSSLLIRNTSSEAQHQVIALQSSTSNDHLLTTSEISSQLEVASSQGIIKNNLLNVSENVVVNDKNYSVLLKKEQDLSKATANQVLKAIIGSASSSSSACSEIPKQINLSKPLLVVPKVSPSASSNSDPLKLANNITTSPVLILPTSPSAAVGKSLISKIAPNNTSIRSAAPSATPTPILLISSSPQNIQSPTVQGNQTSSLKISKIGSEAQTTQTRTCLTAASSLSNLPKQQSISAISSSQSSNNFMTYVKCTDKQGSIFLVPQVSVVRTPTSSSTPSTSFGTKVSGNVPPNQVSLSAATTVSSQSSLLVSNKTAAASNPTRPDSLPTYILQLVPSKTGGAPQAQLVRLAQPSVSSSVTVVSPSLTTTSSFVKTSTLTSSISPSKGFQPYKSSLLKTTPPSEIKFNIDLLKTKNQVLTHFAKQFPLIAPNPDRTLHPYCAATYEMFLSWNIGKQRAAEWQRAKAIRVAIQNSFKGSQLWKDQEIWSCKSVLHWCRHYGFTPLQKGSEESSSEDNQIVDSKEFSTYSDAKELLKNLVKSEVDANKSEAESESDNEIIDIVTIDKPKPQKQSNTFTKAVDSNIYHNIPISPEAEYVQDAAQQIGISLKPEEIIPGVMASVTQEMILAVTKLFAEEILREGLAENFKGTADKKNKNAVSAEDIYKGIKNIPYCDFLTNKYLGVELVNDNNSKKDKAL